MIHDALLAFGRFVSLHPGLTYVCVFLVPVAIAYWRFALMPYRRARSESLLTPGRVAQPAVPGVLERYAAWELTRGTVLSPFALWLHEELARQHLSLADLAQRGDLALDALIEILYGQHPDGSDPSLIRRLAGLLGAGEHQIDRLLRSEHAAGAELDRRP